MVLVTLTVVMLLMLMIKSKINIPLGNVQEPVRVVHAVAVVGYIYIYGIWIRVVWIGVTTGFQNSLFTTYEVSVKVAGMTLSSVLLLDC